MSRTPSTVKARTSTGRVPVAPASRPDEVRTVALVGHSGAGKTTLVEHLLARAGAVPRAGSVPDGTTVSDADPVEHAQQRSVFLSACPLRWGDTLVNLLDTPGFADFVGELRAGLRAADGVLFAVSACEPIDDTVRALWEECAALVVPRAVVVTHLDAPRADLAATVAACREAFGVGGTAVVPMYEREGDALVPLLEADDPAHADARGVLLEAIIAESEDETLLEQYLEGARPDPAALAADLHTALGRGHLHPVLPVCGALDLGLTELLDLVVAGFPTPTERPLPVAYTPVGATAEPLRCDPDGPLAAEVVRTWVDPYLGRLSLARVFSGTIRPDTPLHVSRHGTAGHGRPDHDDDERTASLLSACLVPVDAVVAGDLCVVTRLTSAETGDTLSDRSDPLVLLPWELPDPLLPLAVRAATRNDEDALAKALRRLEATDPAVRVDRNAETGQLVLWCLGEAHAAVVLDRLHGGGAEVLVEDVRVPLRATPAATTRGLGRHVKQSGGHGQYAVCELELEPLERGAGVDFVDRTVGGSVPHQYVGSVEKGARAQLARGLEDGVPVVDVRVTLLDGKAHSVDSSDAAFQAAGALAVREACAAAGLVVLEPVDEITVTVPDDCIGAVLSDLATRRGRVTGTAPAETSRAGAWTVVHAEVPQAELVAYATPLRSLTGGTATFTRTYARHRPRAVPTSAAAP